MIRGFHRCARSGKSAGSDSYCTVSWSAPASLFASQAIPPSAQPAATKPDRANEGWSGKV